MHGGGARRGEGRPLWRPLAGLTLLVVAAAFWGHVAPGSGLGLPRHCTENPVILVYHTHGSEGYRNGSILRVGRQLALELCRRGYRVLHLTAIFDFPGRGSAYQRARAFLEPFLAAHPSLQILVDVHRDAPGRDQTTGRLDGKEAVRILLVVGRQNPRFDDTDRLARAFVVGLVGRQSDLNRGIRYKDGRYNQDLRPLSLLVEFGGVSNTLEEALRTVPVVAEVIREALEAVAEDEP